MKFIQLLCTTILILFICLGTLPAQENSLHLVGTITGISEQNRIYSAKGAGDINNDGHSDFIVTFLRDTIIDFLTYYKPYTNLYYGTGDFDTIPDLSFKSSYAYPVGDVNNDGYDDLMVNEIDYSNYPRLSTFKLYKGGEELDTVPVFKYTPPYLLDMMFSENIEDIGDLNGDGFRDFIISSTYNWSDGRGRVYVFHGGDTLAEQPAQILSVNLVKNGTSFFGHYVTGIGDMDNDGFDDLLISELSLGGTSSNVQLYLGGPEIDSIPSQVLTPQESKYGNEIHNAGDINNDGKTEIIIAGKFVRLYSLLDEIKIIDPSIWAIGGYFSIGVGGDINNDGYNDFLIGNTNVVDSLDTWLGAVFGYWGSNEFDTIPAYNILGTKRGGEFGKSIDIVGDINKDDYDDVFILSPSYPDFNNPNGKLFIYSYKTISSVGNNDNSNKAELFQVNQNYPNPFNPGTVIGYKLSFTGSIIINIYDVLGKQIARISEGIKSPGEYSFTFSSRDYNLTTGTYFIEFTIEPINSSTGIYRKVTKTLLLK